MNPVAVFPSSIEKEGLWREFPVRERHDKLVRDGIPEIVELAGYRYEIAILSEAEYRSALGEKLLEEAREVAGSLDNGPRSPIEELADLQEATDALLELTGIDRDRLYRERREKRELRGGFRGSYCGRKQRSPNGRVGARGWVSRQVLTRRETARDRESGSMYGAGNPTVP